MKVLLDTHTFIWWDSQPHRLSATVMALLQDPSTTALLSVASVWEMVIKSQLGKLTLGAPLGTILAQQQANGIQILPVALDHVLALETLPTAHRDPFDRLLVAQAISESAALLSSDPILASYPVQILW